MILGLGQKMCKMSLEHFVLPENKGNYQRPLGSYQKDAGVYDQSPNGPKLGINKNNNCYGLNHIKYLKNPRVHVILKQINKNPWLAPLEDTRELILDSEDWLTKIIKSLIHLLCNKNSTLCN